MPSHDGPAGAEDTRHLAERAAADATAARAEADETRVDLDETRANLSDTKVELQETRVELGEVEDRERGRGDPQFGRLGRPLKRNSPFMLGFLGALGVFVAYSLVQAVAQARSVIILIVVSLFLAVGLNPVVEAMTRRGLRRGYAISIVFLMVIGAFAAFAVAVVPPVVAQTNELVTNVPGYLDDLRGSATIRKIDKDYGVISKAQAYVSSGDLGQRLFGGILGVGRVVLSAVFSALTVLTLTLYFLAALPSMKRQAYRLVPSSRRERVTLLTDEILVRIGGFVSGAFTVAFIAAVTSYVFIMILGLPFALALAVFVGLLDLVPLVGATIGAAVVTALGFTDSPASGVACLLFYLAYQQVENYLIYPRVMRKAVDVPAAVTVVAVLLGGALLGVVGALLAIPVAAAVLLVVRQVAMPRMDRV